MQQAVAQLGAVTVVADFATTEVFHLSGNYCTFCNSSRIHWKEGILGRWLISNAHITPTAKTMCRVKDLRNNLFRNFARASCIIRYEKLSNSLLDKPSLCRLATKSTFQDTFKENKVHFLRFGTIVSLRFSTLNFRLCLRASGIPAYSLSYYLLSGQK